MQTPTPARLHGPLPLSLAVLPLAGLAAELRRIEAAREAAYWMFTRCARGAPVPAWMGYAETWAREALRRERVGAV